MGRPLLPLISVEALTTAALELVDEGGDFSFPKLAKKIGVSQSSIYNHVSGRDEILELLRHRIITEEPYAAGGPQRLGSRPAGPDPRLPGRVRAPPAAGAAAGPANDH